MRLPMSSTSRAHPNLGEGWQAIVDRLERDLRKVNGEFELRVSIDTSGLLMFPIADFDPGDAVRLKQAQIDASKTCELCGGPGSIRSGFILSVRCDVCDAH